MKKPQPKYEVKIVYEYEPSGVIAVAASQDMLEDFRVFCACFYKVISGYYELSISPHYDFNEVLQYIRSKENG